MYQSENYLFFADQKLYLAKMCYEYLKKWRDSQGEVKKKYLEKFKRHAVQIEKGFETVDLEIEHEILEIKFRTIVKKKLIFSRFQKERKERYTKRNSTLGIARTYS